MNFEERFKAEWISAANSAVTINSRTKDISVLEDELLNIKNSLSAIEDKQRILANLSKLY
ncbi:hypothetical protein IJ732_06535 [bacterium]|nr:hypothetical protein [bacterium]